MSLLKYFNYICKIFNTLWYHQQFVSHIVDMEDAENKKDDNQVPDTVFSKIVSAGKRIYYIDVKKNRQGNLYLTITESKRIVTNGSDQTAVHYEKHKVFLLKNDFDKFLDALNESISYIRDNDEFDNIPFSKTVEFNAPIDLKIDF